MSISFNSIPINIRTPGRYVEFDNSNAVKGTPAMPHLALCIGQVKTAGTGTVAVKTPTLIPSGPAAEGYFGVGSQIAEMCKAFKVADPYTELWAIALGDDVAGVVAEGTITLDGTATADGTLYAYIGGILIRAAVAEDDTSDDVATTLAAAIEDCDALPVSAAVNGVTTDQVDITCKWKGTTGNDIPLAVNFQMGDAYPAGITAVAVQMASGAVSPDYADAITAMADTQFHTIALGVVDATNIALVEAELDTRFGPMVQTEGMAFTAAHGTQGDLTTLGNARNSPHVCIMGAGKSPTAPWIWAAAVAAVDAREVQIDPARPMQSLLIPGTVAPDLSLAFTRAERNILLTDGIATYTVDASGNCRIERLITTYQTNDLSVPDTSYLDSEIMRTLAYLRYSINARIGLRFPRHKLASDGTNFSPGQAIVTPSIIRNELLSLFREWERDGLAEDYDTFKEGLLVERNGNDANRVDALIPPDVINQFRVFAGQIQFLV